MPSGQNFSNDSYCRQLELLRRSSAVGENWYVGIMLYQHHWLQNGDRILAGDSVMIFDEICWIWVNIEKIGIK